MSSRGILIVGGYGEVGRRLEAQLEATFPNRTIVAGRHPERARRVGARRIDVEDPESIELAFEGVGVVVACVRQREPHLLRAAIRRGIAYTSIAPPWMPWSAIEPLDAEAKRTGARAVLAAGLEPGITSVLVRAAADRLGHVDAVQTAMLLGLGDAYGADSMAFMVEEIGQPYAIVVDGRTRAVNAFERSKIVAFPAPIGRRRAYTCRFVTSSTTRGRWAPRPRSLASRSTRRGSRAFFRRCFAWGSGAHSIGVVPAAPSVA